MLKIEQETLSELVERLRNCHKSLGDAFFATSYCNAAQKYGGDLKAIIEDMEKEGYKYEKRQ
mgnify:CR=1 FL=1